MRNVPDKVVDKIKIQILCSRTFCWISFFLWHRVDKYCGDGQATDDMVYAYWMLDSQG